MNEFRTSGWLSDRRVENDPIENETVSVENESLQ